MARMASWLKILSRLRKPGIATQKYKKVKTASLNFYDSASTLLIDDYHKMLLDIINCQNSGFRQKSLVLILVKIKQYCLDNAHLRAWCCSGIINPFFKREAIVVYDFVLALC